MRSQFCAHSFSRSPAKLAAVVSPRSLAPISEATRLTQQQMKQRVAVSRIRGGYASPNHLVGKQSAHLPHRRQHALVSLHPGNVAGPTAALHVETMILSSQLLDDFFKLFRRPHLRNDPKCASDAQAARAVNALRAPQLPPGAPDTRSRSSRALQNPPLHA